MQQVHEQLVVLAQHAERLVAERLELLVQVVRLEALPAHHVCHLRREHEGRALAQHAHLGLEVPQEVPEVDVEQRAVAAQHDVAGVPVGHAQHVGSHAVAGARGHEVEPRLLVVGLARVALAQEVVDGLHLQRAQRAAAVFLFARDIVC